jgi:prepilin-type N-terminal cleavage/methylation domain-containing protein
MSHLSSRARKGFTLIELMIVIAIIAIIAAIAIPNLLAARLSSNETAAIATIRNVISAQAQFQQSARADTDADGTGEYGGFVELSGGGAGRMVSVLNPPVLSGAFRVLNATGAVSRSGYFFHLYLPGAAGVAIAEPAAGYTGASAINADLAETTWCCYAWPVNYSQSGNRTFFTNQGGDLVATEFSGYSGATGPAADAAFQASATAGTITGAVAIGVVGKDSHTWKQVN